MTVVDENKVQELHDCSSVKHSCSIKTLVTSLLQHSNDGDGDIVDNERHVHFDMSLNETFMIERRTLSRSQRRQRARQMRKLKWQRRHRSHFQL